MKRDDQIPSTCRERGFSLLEMMIVLLILSIVLAVIMRDAIQLMQVNMNETNKVDLVQESRQFIDQISNDIHQAGYPGTRMFDPAGSPAQSSYAAGLISVTTNTIQFEGDVDGSGQVSEVYIQLVIPKAGCPCTLQRGAVSKTLSLSGATPAYYTEVEGVMNTNVFTAYFYDGNSVTLPAISTDLPNIKIVKITLDLRSRYPDLRTQIFPEITMVSSAKINN